MLNAPKIIDLYAGVGGLSLGAVKAGFDLIGAVESERRIIDSHAHNFPKTKHICLDISILTGNTLTESVGVGKTELAGIIGGPPCQGFSTIGKRSLKDKRNFLFINFFKLVSEIKPVFFLAENVPGILNERYSKLRNNAIKLVEKEYLLLDPIKIAANDFGAATIRTRVFFIGIRKDMPNGKFIPEAINKLKSPKSVFVKTALNGLPMEISDEWIDYHSSWRKLQSSESNEYTSFLNEIMDGIGDSAAIKRLLKKKEVSGCFGTRHSKDVAERYAKLKPGQQDDISKSIRLNADGFCPTLRAGTDNTKGSFQAVRPIHYIKPRVITPREAARLQGFPDWFQFHETKWHSFRQIGNSVCPIVAMKILLAIKQTLNI
jgi:DNA (cytosine-5)-methyltransferase 1